MVYVTELTHHCIHKCLRVVGLGNCIIRNVDTDLLGRMNVKDLERRIVEDKQVHEIFVSLYKKSFTLINQSKSCEKISLYRSTNIASLMVCTINTEAKCIYI